MKRILLTIGDKITNMSISIAEMIDDNPGNLHIVDFVPQTAWKAKERLRFTGKPPGDMIEFLRASSQDLVIIRRRLIRPIIPTRYRARIVYDNGVHILELSSLSA